MDDDEAGDRLGRYRQLRDFGRTPEPAGEPRPAAGAARFVVQEHHATSLHWDLRLERDGVLVSWAVPKGIPRHPRVDHLAVRTEDHPLDYLDFAGHIPEGHYGAGRMAIWDGGDYACEKWGDDEVVVVLRGERVQGRYVLFRTGGTQWMLHRMDPADDPGRQPLPSGVCLVPLVAAGLPDDEASWSFEPAWGGLRVQVSSEGGRARVVDEGGAAVAGGFPELRDLGRALGAVEVVLEGEIVVTGPDGRPDAAALGRRAGAGGGGRRRGRPAGGRPAVLFVADVLWLEGHATTALPHRQRRHLLERLGLEGPSWPLTPSRPGEGAALLAAARAQGLAGVVGRRQDGGYDQGSLVFVPA